MARPSAGDRRETSANPRGSNRQVNAEDRAHSMRCARLREPNGPGDVVAVRQSEPLHAPLSGSPHQGLGMGCAVAHGIAGRYVEMHEPLHVRPDLVTVSLPAWPRSSRSETLERTVPTSQIGCVSVT